ncbi:ABC-type branched-subunit amino acid transport system substrate-binding protein [Amycolatopsis bartoniae]|uniref:Branched-chain amino acid ABC transporter substrate-binding protein n=1 Tax=Amycolatopsis bartoniae TaxID=941986 RepID=A0A8H9IZX9_9PSEU|nr:ABC transporter substrate-binding protein [Amycolatopsis bartoniae]MBB2935561.1 ABC-type branched-subunit amino acid transport system substrate-binding protein [Amycolatopsis bartoniae]TVT05254.1 ABC transporter substrate-binding protein [Amycolatopsis bartoniae]GHF76785.1 branched-chain amino acid ABC transporter substrate-binding protein [Amycolatopsis bartoniae]
MKVRRRFTAVVAVVSAVALVATGCGRGTKGGEGSASPGITDTTITLGITTPLSGATAGPGTCTVAGVKAYFGAANAAGGVRFGDGKTRKVDIKIYDDAYDPQKSLANFQQMVSDNVFAATAGLGTPTNRAFREAAIDEKVPQVLVMTGDPLFSNRKDSPWQLGFVPIYQNEGAAFGKLLASSGGQHKVAILAQNDDYGKGYVDGFKQAIAGAANVQVVRELSYEATDTSVDAQVTELAATGADVFFNAMSITPLAIASLQKAQQIGWKPSWFLPSNTSSPTAILQPGGATAFPGVYSVAFAKAPQSPEFAKDADVVKFLSDLKQYANYPDTPAFPHCMWSYMVGATLQQAFEKMTEPTRDSFMTALRGISGYQAPLMLQGTSVNTTTDGQPAVSSVVVQKYNGKGYATAQTFG